MQAFMVWAVLRKYADNETGKAWPSRETIADHLGIKPKGVDRYIKEIEDKGLVRVERRRPRPNALLAGDSWDFSGGSWEFHEDVRGCRKSSRGSA
ncbi:helix-turn-helix domain-containing protein [Prescottella defluvii]|nr:helix-turn-helix domain-containing protein [Prescottella defluvii]